MVSKKQTGTRVKKWLENEGYNVQLSTPSGWEFAIQIIDPFQNGINVSIAEPVKIEVLGITVQLIMPPTVIEIVKKLPKVSKIELIQSLHRTLLSMIQDHVIDGELKSIKLTERIYVENLTRQKLFESILKLRNTLLYLISVLRHNFGQEEAPQPSTTNHSFYG